MFDLRHNRGWGRRNIIPDYHISEKTVRRSNQPPDSKKSDVPAGGRALNHRSAVTATREPPHFHLAGRRSLIANAAEESWSAGRVRAHGGEARVHADRAGAPSAIGDNAHDVESDRWARRTAFSKLLSNSVSRMAARPTTCELTNVMPGHLNHGTAATTDGFEIIAICRPLTNTESNSSR
jgi:hypothetical protein